MIQNGSKIPASEEFKFDFNKLGPVVDTYAGKPELEKKIYSVFDVLEKSEAERFAQLCDKVTSSIEQSYLKPQGITWQHNGNLNVLLTVLSIAQAIGQQIGMLSVLKEPERFKLREEICSTTPSVSPPDKSDV